MKKIFVMLCAVAALVSCVNGEREFYFEGFENRVYNNPEAEFDTLSYAVGMNMGLSMVLHPAGNIFDLDVVAKTFNEEMSKEVVDKEFIKQNQEYLQRFYNEKLQRVIMARRFAAAQKEDAMMPSVFDNGEYAVEKVSNAFGYDMANHVRKSEFPVNLHWMMRAMEDAKNVNNEKFVDDFMALESMTFRRVMTNYFTKEYPEHMDERSDKWFEALSKKRGVHMLAVEGDTLYYRVDKAGNGKSPQSLRDTVSFTYDVYTMRGDVVESHNERVETLKSALAEAEADTTSAPEMREMRIERIKGQLETTENLKVVLDRAIIKGSKYGIQKASEGGDITLWIPASLAYGSRGNKVVSPNEPIVMTIHLNSVAYGPSEEEIAAKQIMAPKFSKKAPTRLEGNPSINAAEKSLDAEQSNESGKGVKVVKPITVKPVKGEAVK
ncbi:MAG: FKBP-type peptidyl-prolyl cis-trans isomerase [Alistipes sp.]|nr:FKBP-type peptidyl-prolyl cis-trans isomerase [Alistipes sp.]